MKSKLNCIFVVVFFPMVYDEKHFAKALKEFLEIRILLVKLMLEGLSFDMLLVNTIPMFELIFLCVYILFHTISSLQGV